MSWMSRIKHQACTQMHKKVRGIKINGSTKGWDVLNFSLLFGFSSKNNGSHNSHDATNSMFSLALTCFNSRAQVCYQRPYVTPDAKPSRRWRKCRCCLTRQMSFFHVCEMVNVPAPRLCASRRRSESERRIRGCLGTFTVSCPAQKDWGHWAEVHTHTCTHTHMCTHTHTHTHTHSHTHTHDME